MMHKSETILNMLLLFSFPSATSLVYRFLILLFKRHAVTQSTKTAKAQINTKGSVGCTHAQRRPKRAARSRIKFVSIY
jgi:hypothetical protein